VSTFCAEHDIARSTFYALRARAIEEGQAAVLAPKTRRPKSSPRTITDEVKQQAVQVRAALESSGLDHGPISVHDKMVALGLTAPSVASLARIFRQAGVARSEPRKRPRASYRRFVYPAPNACWQLDATEYVLQGGRKCVIFQLEDDHSRLAIASHAATGETSRDAVIVFQKGVAKHGVPQRLLTDNGAALNPARRGWIGQLTAYATSLGVEAITGKPYKPTTQGKNERFHQTLFRYLDKQPIAATLAELQEQVEAFDVVYNTQRPHQGLPGRLTPQAAWDATPVAEAPRPRPAAERPMILDPAPGAPGSPLPFENMVTRRVKSSGAIAIKGVTYQIARELAGQSIYIAQQTEGVKFYDQTGELLLEHPWPAPGTKHVSNGRPRGAGAKRPEHITDAFRRVANLPPGEYRRTVRTDGRVSIRGVVYGLGQQHTGRDLHVVIDEATATFSDAITGELITEHSIPEPGATHVGYVRYNRRTPTFEPAETNEVSEMS
jgi:transposase InsO family protein